MTSFTESSFSLRGGHLGSPQLIVYVVEDGDAIQEEPLDADDFLLGDMTGETRAVESQIVMAIHKGASPGWLAHEAIHVAMAMQWARGEGLNVDDMAGDLVADMVEEIVNLVTPLMTPTTSNHTY